MKKKGMGDRKGIRPIKSSGEVLVMLSGVRCKRFAYGQADATVTPSSLASLKFQIVYLLVAGLLRVS